MTAYTKKNRDAVQQVAFTADGMDGGGDGLAEDRPVVLGDDPSVLHDHTPAPINPLRPIPIFFYPFLISAPT